jgi:hypothetical protein
MKKIPCVFKRDFSDKLNPKILNEVTSGCEWVLAGEGVATRKRDGTACLFRNGHLFRRYDAKRGKVPPDGFEAAQDPDPLTGHWPGWLEVNVWNPDAADVWHALAYFQETHMLNATSFHNGTYELVGPKVNANHEGLTTYHLISHGSEQLLNVPRTFEGIREFLRDFNSEGIVFWRTNSDMAKITRESFGFAWPIGDAK